VLANVQFPPPPYGTPFETEKSAELVTPVTRTSPVAWSTAMPPNSKSSSPEPPTNVENGRLRLEPFNAISLTNASELKVVLPPPNVPYVAPCTGKSGEVVVPVTYAVLITLSKAMLKP
jgi:hypothetical protein